MAKRKSLNQISLEIVKQLVRNCHELKVAAKKLKNGTTVVDTGVNVRGGFEAGKLVTKVSLGGLAEVHIDNVTYDNLTLPTIFVSTDHPALSIAVCQWSWRELFPSAFAAKEDEFSALVSGPGKAVAQKPEDLFQKIRYQDDSDIGVFLLQASRLPDEEVADRLAGACKIDPKNLYLVVAPTESIAGSVQVSARILEDALWRLTEYLGFDINRIDVAVGSCPIAPVFPRMWKEPGITPDDMIRNAGRIHLFVRSKEDEDLESMVKDMVIENTAAYGKSFYQILKDGGLGGKTDIRTAAAAGLSYVQAEVMISDLRTGKMFKAGKVHTDLIKKFASLP